jgi:hypothetical protein
MTTLILTPLTEPTARTMCPQRQNCQHPYCDCFPGAAPSPTGELNHSCTSQCPLPCDAASSVTAPSVAPTAASDCGNPNNCAFPHCACVFMPDTRPRRTA